nr:phosphatase and actin regulator 4A-like [Ipomoea batatas]
MPPRSSAAVPPPETSKLPSLLYTPEPRSEANVELLPAIRERKKDEREGDERNENGKRLLITFPSHFGNFYPYHELGVLQPRVDLEDKAKLANDDEELKNVVEISSISDSEASTCHMDERRLALRARHKGKVTTTEKGKDKAVDLASADPTLAARLPSVGASPIAVALALAHQPRQRTPGSRQASDSSAPTTSKKAKRTLDSNRDEGVPTAKAFIFRRLEQLIIASDLQPFEGTSPSYLLQLASYHSLRAQLFQVGLNNAIKALSKDSELLKSAKRESSKKLAVELRSAWEIALKEFRESETFHEEVMIHVDMHARTVVDKWLAGPMGKQFLLDLGEEDYDLGY